MEGPLRYVRVPDGNTVSEELFDASVDPAELRNLAAERTEDLERLREIGTNYLESGGTPWGAAYVFEANDPPTFYCVPGISAQSCAAPLSAAGLASAIVEKAVGPQQRIASER